MKFNTGDEVLVRATVVEDDHDKSYATIKFEGAIAFSMRRELLQEILFIPIAAAPVRWRDGAVEQPKYNSRVWYQDKYDDKCNISFADNVDGSDYIWRDDYWLYADEFPMPLPPAPIAEHDRLTARIAELEAEVERLRAQLPEVDPLALAKAQREDDNA